MLIYRNIMALILGIIYIPLYSQFEPVQTRFFVSSASCNQVITQANVPAILTQPGVYCLGESLDGQGSITIDIRANNLILDLNGKEIANGSININAQNVQDIIIKNGFIQGATQINVMFSNAVNITVSDIDISQSFTGILVSTSTQIELTNINFRSHTNEVIAMNTVNTAQITNCSMKFNRHINTVLLQDSSNLIFTNVTAAEKNSVFDSPTNVAGFHTINASNCTFTNCDANNNTNTGTALLAGFLFEQGNDIRCINCTASGNQSGGGTFGFRTMNQADRIKITNCVASDNVSTGSDSCGIIIIGNDNLVENSFSNDNVATVTAVGIHIESTALRTTIINNITKNNSGTLGSVGIENNSTSSSIFNNISQQNNTANYLGAAPTILYDPSSGAFTGTPVPFDNVDVS